MRFAKALAAAATVAYVAEANASLTTVLEVANAPFATKLSFWKKVFLNMQRDTTNSASQCQEAYDEATAMYNTLSEQLFGPDAFTKYSTALQSKGQGAGTIYGKFFYDVEQYIELATSGVAVYNACEVKFYTQAISKIFAGIPGIVNQMVNIFFRNQDTTLFEAIATALTDEDEDACAEALGPVIVLVFNVQVPEVAGISDYQNTDVASP